MHPLTFPFLSFIIQLGRGSSQLPVTAFELDPWLLNKPKSYPKAFQSYAASSTTTSDRETAICDLATTKDVDDFKRSLQESNSSIMILSNRATPSTWQCLAPGLLQNSRGLDSRMEWSTDDATSEEAARDFLINAGVFDKNEAPDMQRELSEAFETFCKFTMARRIRARIVASRGPAASTKCPQWHIDHVPIRWIQSLVGPGCDYVADRHDDWLWEKINALDDEAEVNLSAEERNRLLVDPDRVTTRQVPEGAAALLPGNEWKQWAKEKVLPNEFWDLKPVIHKSPSNIMAWQGRVLLTLDVVQ